MAEGPTPKIRAADRKDLLNEQEAAAKAAELDAKEDARPEAPAERKMEGVRPRSAEDREVDDRDAIVASHRKHRRDPKKLAIADQEEDQRPEPEPADDDTSTPDQPTDEDLGNGVIRRAGVVGMELTVSGRKVFRSLEEIRSDGQKLMYADQQMSQVNSERQRVAEIERQAKALQDRYLAEERERNANKGSPKTERQMVDDAKAAAKRAAAVMVSGTQEEIEQAMAAIYDSQHEMREEIERLRAPKSAESVDIEQIKQDVIRQRTEEEEIEVAREWLHASGRKISDSEDSYAIGLRTTLASMLSGNRVLQAEFDSAIDEERRARTAEGRSARLTLDLMNAAAKRTHQKHPWIATGIEDSRQQQAAKEGSARRMVKSRGGPAHAPPPRDKTIAEARAGRIDAVIKERTQR